MFRRKLDSSLFKNRIVQGAILGNKNSTKLVPYICTQPDISKMHLFSELLHRKNIYYYFIIFFGFLKKFFLRFDGNATLFYSVLFSTYCLS